jgi:hypothetical protein
VSKPDRGLADTQAKMLNQDDDQPISMLFMNLLRRRTERTEP